MTAGRRLCAYAVVPGAAKAAGTVLKGAISPGSTFTNPIKGSALQDAINGDPKVPTSPNPTNLANKWVQTGNGPVQLGGYAGQGSFASVFRYGTSKAIKLSRSNPQTLGYGPQSIEGQYTGAGRVQAAGEWRLPVYRIWSRAERASQRRWWRMMWRRNIQDRFSYRIRSTTA